MQDFARRSRWFECGLGLKREKTRALGVAVHVILGTSALGKSCPRRQLASTVTGLKSSK
jgi:hypothetical protein